MFKRKSVLYTWCISYGLLLLMMVVLCIVLGHRARTQLIREYKSITQTLQQQTRTSFESYIHRLERTAYEIGNNYLVMDFIAMPDPSGSKYYNLVPIQQSLAVHALQYSGTVRQYLYMNNIDRALCSDAIYRGHEFYSQLSLSDAMTEQEFSELLHAHHYNQLFVFQIDGRAQAMMLTSVPLVGSTPKATLVQVMPPETFQEMMRSNNAVEDSTTVLLDADGTLMNWTGDETAAALLSAADFSSAQDSELALGGEPYWIECQQLSKAAWKLVTVVPMQSISKKSDWIVRQSLPIMVVMVLSSGALCLLFLYIQYKPLNRLRKQLTDASDVQTDGNEYDQVLAAFTDARNGRDQIQTLWEMQLDRLWDELARSCIQDDMVYDEARLREVMEHLGAGFVGEWFGVALLDSAEGAESDAAGEPGALLAPALAAAVPPESGVYAKLLRCGPQWLALMNAPGENDIAQALARLGDSARARSLLCACSRPWNSFQNIHLAYLEASQALHQQTGGGPPERRYLPQPPRARPSFRRSRRSCCSAICWRATARRRRRCWSRFCASTGRSSN